MSKTFEQLGFPKLSYTKISLPDQLQVYDGETGNLYQWNSLSMSKIPNRAGFICSFYVEDWRFKKMLSDVKAAQVRLQGFDYVIQPDFSVYYDTALIDQYWRTWMGFKVAAVWQNLGIKIIPNLVLGSADNFEAAIYPIPKHQTFAVQLQANDGNLMQNTTDLETITKAIDLIEPDNVIIYATQDRMDKLGLRKDDKIIKRVYTKIDKLRELN